MLGSLSTDDELFNVEDVRHPVSETATRQIDSLQQLSPERPASVLVKLRFSRMRGSSAAGANVATKLMKKLIQLICVAK